MGFAFRENKNIFLELYIFKTVDQNSKLQGKTLIMTYKKIKDFAIRENKNLSQ